MTVYTCETCFSEFLQSDQEKDCPLCTQAGRAMAALRANSPEEYSLTFAFGEALCAQ